MHISYAYMHINEPPGREFVRMSYLPEHANIYSKEYNDTLNTK